MLEQNLTHIGCSSNAFPVLIGTYSSSDQIMVVSAYYLLLV